MTRTEAEQRVLEAAWELARHPLRAGALMALNDAALALSDATEDAAPASPWRPIETAPRGGQWFLWCAADGTKRFTQAVIRWPEYKECFAEGWWMPLPAPPTTSDGSK